jgi:hypothetical protein
MVNARLAKKNVERRSSVPNIEEFKFMMIGVWLKKMV